MHGWISVGLLVLAFAAATIVLIRSAIRRWWEYGLLLLVAAILSKPLYDLVSGDVSRYLPGFLWSDGPDGKDQIILASIASTIILPLIVSAALMLAFTRIRSRRA